MALKIKQSIKNYIRNLLASRGYVITRHNPRVMEGAFQAIAGRKHIFETVIDIGASDGSWSALFMHYYPDCTYFLIEAQRIHENDLQKFCADHENAQFALSAAGEKSGFIYFDASDPLSGQASYAPFPSNNVQVPCISIDDEVQTRGLKPPYLLKFDTHGFEVPILKGAMSTLAETDVVIMECYNFKIAPECLLFNEMGDYMKGLGFRCIDLVDPLYRPHDGSFWQMDLVFVKEDRPEFSYLKYQ